MNLRQRIWRLARRRLLDGLGRVAQTGRRNLSGPAADPLRQALEELEEYLRGAARAAASERTRPPGGPRSRPRNDATRASAPPPPRHPLETEYRLLGAPIGSDLATVRSCWRRLVSENHPDRFAHDPLGQRQANERLLKINQAYFRLRDYLQTSAR